MACGIFFLYRGFIQSCAAASPSKLPFAIVHYEFVRTLSCPWLWCHFRYLERYLNGQRCFQIQQAFTLFPYPAHQVLFCFSFGQVSCLFPFFLIASYQA